MKDWLWNLDFSFTLRWWNDIHDKTHTNTDTCPRGMAQMNLNHFLCIFAVMQLKLNLILCTRDGASKYHLVMMQMQSLWSFIHSRDGRWFSFSRSTIEYQTRSDENLLSLFLPINPVAHPRRLNQSQRQNTPCRLQMIRARKRERGTPLSVQAYILYYWRKREKGK